jgi:hypothetical protein
MAVLMVTFTISIMVIMIGVTNAMTPTTVITTSDKNRFKYELKFQKQLLFLYFFTFKQTLNK